MTQQINFYSPLLRRQAFTLLSAAGMAYAVGIAAALCALAGAYESYALNAAQIQAHATDEVHKNVTQVYENVVRKSKIQKPDPRLTAEVAALEARAQDRQAVMDALASKELANTSGFSEYMRAFARRSVTGLWLTGFDIAGGELTLQGRTISADLVARYLQQLNQEQAMQGRQFAALLITQPPRETGAQAAEADATLQKGVPEQKSAAPAYLDFNISTLEPREAQPQAKTVALQTSSVGPLLQPVLNAKKVLEGAELAR